MLLNHRDQVRSCGLQQSVGLLPVHRHPHPGEGEPEEAVGLLEDGGELHGRAGPRADLESTTPVDTGSEPLRSPARQPGVSEPLDHHSYRALTQCLQLCLSA